MLTLNQYCTFHIILAEIIKSAKIAEEPVIENSIILELFRLIATEPLIGHGKIKIPPCIKSCAQDDLVITRK